MCNRKLQIVKALSEVLNPRKRENSLDDVDFNQEDIVGIDDEERVRKNDFGIRRKKLPAEAAAEPDVEEDIDLFSTDGADDDAPFTEKKPEQSLKVIEVGSGPFVAFASCSAETLLVLKSKENKSVGVQKYSYPDFPTREGIGRR